MVLRIEIVLKDVQLFLLTIAFLHEFPLGFLVSLSRSTSVFALQGQEFCARSTMCLPLQWWVWFSVMGIRGEMVDDSDHPSFRPTGMVMLLKKTVCCSHQFPWSFAGVESFKLWSLRFFLHCRLIDKPKCQWVYRKVLTSSCHKNLPAWHDKTATLRVTR